MNTEIKEKKDWFPHCIKTDGYKNDFLHPFPVLKIGNKQFFIPPRKKC